LFENMFPCLLRISAAAAGACCAAGFQSAFSRLQVKLDPGDPPICVRKVIIYSRRQKTNRDMVGWSDKAAASPSN
jgi:hypothetical protein